jgi:multiple sugar transport system permease protein
MERQRAIQGWLFVSPFILGFILFFIGPMGFAAWISLHDWPILADPTFIGLENFTNMFADDVFWKSMWITTIYTVVSVPLGMAVGLGLAMLLNTKVKGLAVFRTLYYVPSVVTGVSVSVLWWMMFNTQYGLINGVLRGIGIEQIPWLTNTNWVLPAFIIMSLWQVGGGMVIYLAGLQGIPTELYEAAAIDGAGGWSKFINITIPMLSPVLLFNLVLGVIGSFQSFTNALIMTNGGPSQSTLFFVLYIYRNAWQYNQMGYAAALAWALFAVILVLTLLIFRATAERVYYSGGGARGGV